MINLPGYDVIRQDRTNKRGGGVAIYYKNSLNVQLLDNPYINPAYSNFEFSAIKLCSAYPKITFVCFYLPPDSSKCISTISNLCKVISFFLTHNEPFILLGDFNLPSINWATMTAGNSSSQYFLDFCTNNCLTQIISSPTHSCGNILDLVLCNISAKSQINNSKINPPLTTTCDHNLVSLSLWSNTAKQKQIRKPVYNFKYGDYDKINEQLLRCDWSFLYYDSISCQEKYDRYISILNNIIEANIPVKSFSNKKLKLPRHIKKLRRLKLKTYKLLKQGRTSKHNYKTISKKYDYEIKVWHEERERNICECSNKKKLYSYVNKKLNNNFNIPSLEDPNGNLLTNEVDKANLFNSTFHKQFTLDDGKDVLPVEKNLTSNSMPHFVITEQDLYNAISSTKDKLTETPEQIPPYFIKRVAKSLSFPLLYFYNYSITYNIIPSQWKQSMLVPIYKKGDRSQPANYRPIALTSSFCRILETIISGYMLQHLLANSLILPSQFGFLPNRSSCDQLLWCIHDWYKSYCQKNIVHVIYSDITKAFDSVSHTKLITVIKSYGINNSILYWIQNFLSNRRQLVKLSTQSSSFLPILSGVPQGSVLGPLLFIIFINDIIWKVQSQHNVKIALFADDAKFTTTDGQELQYCLDLFSQTISEYQLKLAPHKSSALHICKKSLDNNLQQFQLNSTTIPSTRSIKDLGITIQNNLKWEVHINNIYGKAASLSYRILKCFRSKNIWTLLLLYKSYVRPLLVFNTEVWSPYFKKDIDRIESVQKRYTKLICQRCNIPFSSYTDRLEKLNLTTLHDRRIKFDLILMFKIINNLSFLTFDDFFPLEVPIYQLRHSFPKIKTKQTFNRKSWSESFFVRGPKYWNVLDKTITATKSLSHFKSLLKHVPTSVFIY